jgi:A/G-specific adenine glycosylase
MLGGMAALPGSEWTDRAPAIPAQAVVSQGFTHFTLDLHMTPRAAPADEEGWWQPLDTIDRAGLPTLYRRAVDAMLDRRKNLAA